MLGSCYNKGVEILERVGNKIDGLIFGIKSKALRVISFVAPAPKIEGIPENQQEQSWRRLINLRIKQAKGDKLPFTDLKKLNLSDRLGFYKNNSKLELDQEVVPLSKAVNSKTFACSAGSCSGHLEEKGDRILFNDTGFVSFYLDPSDNRSELLKNELKELCRMESEADPDCEYSLEEEEERDGFPFFFLSWNWNHPVYRRERELIKEGILAADKEKLDQIDLERDQLFDEKIKAGAEAKRLGIHERHMKFVEKAAALINGM